MVKLKQLADGGAADGQVMTWDSASQTWGPESAGGAVGTPVMFEAYQAATGVSWTSATFVDITLDTEREKSADFTYSAGNAFCEIAVAGKFVVVAKVAYEQFTGNSRTNCGFRIMRDTGAGFAEVPGTRSYAYSRNNANGEDNMISVCVLDLAIGDQIKMQANIIQGVGDCRVIANGASLVLFSTIGETGAAGVAGPAGADGVAAISVEDEGTELTAAVTRMDFVGAGVVVTEPTTDEVVVTIDGAPRRHVFEATGKWQGNDSSWHFPKNDFGPNDPTWDEPLGTKAPTWEAMGFVAPFACNVISAVIQGYDDTPSASWSAALIRHRKTYGSQTVVNAQIGVDTALTLSQGESGRDVLDISTNTALNVGDHIIPMAQIDIAATHQLTFNLQIIVEEI